MKILVLNAGSSSHKLCLYNIEDELPAHPPSPQWKAQLDWHPQQDLASVEVENDAGVKLAEELQAVTRSEALAHVLQTLWQGPTQVIEGVEAIDLVGHRVVHGGDRYQASVVVTEGVKAAIADLIPLAPVHNPANLEGIELMEQLLAGQEQSIPPVPQVAVFDTAFHRTLPDKAAIYPGPYDWLKQGIRRYGFHGISHQYCAQRAAQILERDLADLRLIICHLGNGGSLTAVAGGQSIDTTMGYTPLDGLMMGTRSGAVDPGIVIELMRQGQSAEALDHLLNQESGLKGISGISHDLREIKAAIDRGNSRAQLAQDLYIHRFKACFGAMLMSLGGVDTVVFTAGIGERATWIRAAACEGMAFLGAELDLAKNEAGPVDEDIATADSKVRLLVIHTQEDWEIAKQAWGAIAP